MRGQGREERRSLRRVVAQRDDLLALVDHEHRHRIRGRQPAERVHRPGTGGDDHDRTAAALQRGRHPGPHQRRLAAARGPDHHQHAHGRQPSQAGLDLAVPAEEAVGVADVVGHQTQVRTDGSGLGQGCSDHQRGVLAQDRLLQGHQLRTGIDAQLGGEHPPGLVQGSQGLALAAGLVLRQGQQRPPPLPQRRLGRPGLRLGQDLPMVTRP